MTHPIDGFYLMTERLTLTLARGRDRLRCTTGARDDVIAWLAPVDAVNNNDFSALAGRGQDDLFRPCLEIIELAFVDHALAG
jgi:hypothetical protein